MKKNKFRRKMSASDIVYLCVKILVFTVYGIISIFPMYWMVINSFKTHTQIYADMDSFRTFVPSFNISSMFDSYVGLFKEFDLFGKAIFNSLLYAFIVIVLVLLVNSFAGYALSRFVFPGSKLIVTIIILILIVPVETSIVPLYLVLFKLGLLNTNGIFGDNIRIIAYVIPSIVSPFYIFMFRQFFLGIPKDLEEAAKIDGANRLHIYFRIILPLSSAVFSTITIFTFIGVWNDWLWPQLIFTSEKFFPVQVFLQQVNNHNPKDIGMVMAALTFSSLPIAIVYMLFQRRIVEGIAYSGLK